jgi:hypothetical protein
MHLLTTYVDNKLVDEIGNYEKACLLAGVTPSDARLGRWVLLYGILQVLSTVSVDVAGLKYKDKIKYFISPSLEGCPPWRSPEAAPLMIEACQERSYCWTTPSTWGDTKLTPPAYSNHQYELSEHSTPTELDGRVVARSRSVLQTSMGRPPQLTLSPSPMLQAQGDLKPHLPMRSPRRHESPAPSSAGGSYTSSKRVAHGEDQGYFSEGRSVISE